MRLCMVERRVTIACGRGEVVKGKGHQQRHRRVSCRSVLIAVLVLGVVSLSLLSLGGGALCRSMNCLWWRFGRGSFGGSRSQVEDAYKGKESVTGDNGCLSKGEVKDILTKVENFMETQACDTAKMLGVSYNGVDKGLKNSMLLIKRRWMADMARKAKADVGGKLNSEES